MSCDNLISVVYSANVAYLTDRRQKVRLAERLGSDLPTSGGDDPPDQLRPGPALAIDEPVNGRVRDTGLGREGAEGQVVSLAVERKRVHGPNLPKRQEMSSAVPASSAVVRFGPSRQNMDMAKGRPKSVPLADNNRVFELRTREGWSQEELADRAGCHGTTIQRIESGTRGISKRMLPKLARAFKISQAELFSAPARYGSAEEEEAAALVRSMSDEERATWLQTGRILARRGVPSKHRNAA
jgi:transcriptional regulator with XRE-family HTH domain